jgi:hypothetical protein
MRIHRINCLGSLYYFIRLALGRTRLTPTFHQMICRRLETMYMKELFEMPRDHFKSTIACEGLPIFTVLPIGQQDIDLFYELGFDQEFVRWMLQLHDCTKRNLIISENITNAAGLGRRIRRHFESNAIFRSLFPEIIPTSQERWTDFSLSVRQPQGAKGHGEGTFDFLGVGSAAQSRHYNGLIIQDDMVGRKALESASIMEKTIDYHKLISALFDHPDEHHDGSELVIGNRWGYHDLNSHIREHEPWFHIESHSALGGCCDLHPLDQPLFPEEFSAIKLEQLRIRFGNYKFACQFLNNPSSPENADFRESDVNWFTFTQDHMDGSVIVQHAVKDGIIKKDIPFRKLRLAMAADPAHSASGRCRHAIVCIGMSEVGNYYLVDTWAENCSHEKFFSRIYEMAEKWRVRSVGFETCAGQSLALPHIKYLNSVKPWPIRITPLKGEVEGPDGEITTKKEWRIRNILGPIIEFGRWHMQRKHQDFLGELTTFPAGRYVDQLDAAAYIPQLIGQPINPAITHDLLKLNKQQSRQIATPYSLGYGGRS